MVPNIFKYLTDIKAHFTIKNRIAKNKVVSITIRLNFFFWSIIGLIQILRGANSYFCKLNFENIKIIIYIFKKISKFWGGHGPPTLQRGSAHEQGSQCYSTRKTNHYRERWGGRQKHPSQTLTGTRTQTDSIYLFRKRIYLHWILLTYPQHQECASPNS